MLSFDFTSLMIFARHIFAVYLVVFVALSIYVLYFTTISLVLTMIDMSYALLLFFVIPTGRPTLSRSCVYLSMHVAFVVFVVPVTVLDAVVLPSTVSASNYTARIILPRFACAR